MQGYNQAQTNIRPVWDAGVDTRAEFITKTYAHLFGAIVAFVLVEVFLFQSGIADRIAAVMIGNWLYMLGGLMLVSWIGSRFSHTGSMPVQYAVLAVFVVAQAVIFVPLIWIANQYSADGTLLGSAALTTMIGFTGLTAVAFVTRKDFSFLRGMLMWGGVCALVLIVASIIFGFQLGMIFSVAMVAFAGAAILYDTSNVLHHYPKDRYVGASLELFASVALLFWYVLRIFIATRD